VILADQSPLDGDKPRRGGMEFECFAEVLLGALKKSTVAHDLRREVRKNRMNQKHFCVQSVFNPCFIRG
jgi:hypothetical protein